MLSQVKDICVVHLVVLNTTDVSLPPQQRLGSQVHDFAYLTGSRMKHNLLDGFQQYLRERWVKEEQIQFVIDLEIGGALFYF